MAKVIDYEYVQDVSIEDVMDALASDNTHGATPVMPGINTYKIDANNIYNLPEGGDGEGIAGWATDVKWSSNYTSLSWTAGSVYLPDGSSLSISPGSANITNNTYLYCDTTNGAVFSTTNALEAVGENKLMICVAFPSASGKNVSYQAFGCADQSSLVTGGSIASGTITAGNIASGTITSNQIAANTITGNEIAANSIGATEINVSRLSAISANLGTITAGDISGVHITAQDSSGTGIKIGPESNYGRMEIYYNGSRVGYITGLSDSSIGNCVYISGTNILIPGTLYVGGKLRIPVGTDLY